MEIQRNGLFLPAQGIADLLEIGDGFKVNLYRPSYKGEDHQSSPNN